jgi:MFS family permease
MESIGAAQRAHTMPSLSASFVPLLILSLAMAAGFTMMNSFALVQEAAKAEMRLSDTVLGLIQGLSAAVPLVVFSIPIGILVDRSNRVRLMIVLALIWTGGTLLTAYAESAATLFVARMLTGIGTTGALTAALSLAADLCTPQERGRALLIVTLGKSAGQAGAFALSGWVLGMFVAGAAPAWLSSPWRDTHVALAAISLATVLPLLLLREPPRREVEAATDAPFAVLARELWSRRAFLIPLFVGQTSVVMADAAAGIWAAPVLTRSYGLQPQDFAGWMGSIVLISGIVGAILGGSAADFGQKTGLRGGILIGAVIAAALGVPAAFFPVMPNVTGFAAALGLLTLCGTITGLVTSVALTVLIPNELRGLCIGAFIAIAGLIGFGIAPTLVTWVSLLLGGEQHLGRALAAVGAAVSIVSVIAFIQAMRAAPDGAIGKPI